tara:strand:- start:1141 stop:1440 length:300 start_codon:yes stop_codon:yes gene_type:complete
MIRLKNIIKEAKNWIVKDGITMRKTLNKGMIALVALDKAVKALEKLDAKHKGKQNNNIFSSHVKGMRNEVERFSNGKFYAEWKEYEKTGKAIFGDRWND